MAADDQADEVVGVVPFAMIPIWLFELGPHHVAVYGSLASFANNATREGWPSIASIATRAGLGKTRTKEVLRFLVDEGAIIITHRTGATGVSKTSVYDIRPAMTDEGRGRHATPSGRVATGEGSPRDPELEPRELEGVEGGGSSSSLTLAAPASAGAREAERLCTELADAIEANGCKRPTITKTWLSEARLMVDKDNRDPEAVSRAITWATNHAFWKSNILSMPKLREKYDTLRLQAQREASDSGSIGERRYLAAQDSLRTAMQRVEAGGAL